MNVGGRNVYRMKGRRGKRYIFKEKGREENNGIDKGKGGNYSPTWETNLVFIKKLYIFENGRTTRPHTQRKAYFVRMNEIVGTVV